MLQPTRVFKAEGTRQNQMYWLSGYCFERSLAVLRAIASCGHQDADPRVHEVWPSLVDGEARCITVRTSAMDTMLTEVRDTVLVNAMLHICSAFEALLDGLYILGLLYKPELGAATRKKKPVPAALRSQANRNALFAAAHKDVASDKMRLKGPYSRRIQTLCALFSLPEPANAARLDDYYLRRHVIAHDQSLADSSDPLTSYKEILRSRLTLDESGWKSMQSEFLMTAKVLDSEFTNAVVSDAGLCIAVWKQIELGGPQTIGKLRHGVSDMWGLHRTHDEIEAVSKLLGRSVSSEKKVLRRKVT